MKNDKLAFRVVMALSIVVFLVVLGLNKRVITPPENFPSFVYKLPALNAFINGTCFVLLLFSYRAIRAKRINQHKRINLTAFGLSALFLISYVTYHFFVPETTYGGEGFMKSLYYFILITHIPLAALVLPLILMSFYYALNQNITKHRKLVRFTFPIWLYVCLTGVLVYLLISPYYPF